ncbi:MAG: SusC/RagA family TonB-linked outer membrane protein [Sphingobacterium sp.]|nr:SusC/RagA family TonB-linked outer membrane protein [Sphingobacterium sp.]
MTYHLKWCNTLLAMLCCISFAFAQQSVTGIVSDKSGPLSGASVSIKGGTTATQTSQTGAYSIVAKPGDVLRFSLVGFTAQEITVSSAKTINVELHSKDGALGEVVVTALGIKRNPRAIGYSVQQVSGKDLTIAQAPNIAQGLFGKVAGLNISQAAGGFEGGSSRLVVRGNVSLNGDNRAMIVVDGVPINNSAMNNSKVMGGSNSQDYQDWGTGLNLINPDDVESISVLKGAAAAALYGSRGANGVILVTRKKGSKQEGLGVEYSFSDRFTIPYRYLDFQNEYGPGFVSTLWTADQGKQFNAPNGKRRQIGIYTGTSEPKDYLTGAGGFLPYSNSKQAWDFISYPGGLSWGPRFDGKPILWYDGVERPYEAQPDNWKAYFRNGFVRQHNVALSGGGDVATGRFSYTRMDNKANILNSNFNTNTFNLGTTIKISNRLSAEATGSYTMYSRLNTADYGNNNYLAGLMYAMTRDFKPDIEMQNDFLASGAGRDVTNTSNFPDGSPKYPFYSSYLGNSFWKINKNNTTYNRNQLIGGLKINGIITDWLSFVGEVSVDNANDAMQRKNYPTDLQGRLGSYGQDMFRSFNSTMRGTLRLHKDSLFNDKLNASLSGAFESYYRNDYGVSGKTEGNFNKPFIFSLDNGSSPPKAGDERKYTKKINSSVGFLDLSYANYLFLQATMRADWSSTIAKDYLPYVYPGVNMSFVFTDAIKGLKSSPVLNFGKVILSYAETGSDTEPYSIYNTIKTDVYNEQPAQGLPETLKYPSIQPQRLKEYQGGFSLGFFNNRLNMDLTYYSSKSFNQILINPLPISSGYKNVQINRGSLGNKGIEFTINATPIQKGDFTWNVQINGASNKNKVLALDEGNTRLFLGDFQGGSGISQWVKVGDDYGTLYGYDFKYDANGNKLVKRSLGADNINPMTYTVDGKTYYGGTRWDLTKEQVPIGNSQPFLTGGISNTFRYKNFSLYVLTDGKFGGDTYFGSYGTAMSSGLLTETLKERNGGGVPLVYPDGTTSNTGIIMDGVFADGTRNTDVVPAAWYYALTYSGWNHLGENSVPRSASVFKNSWMKLREVSLSYQLPQSFVKRTKAFQKINLSLIGRDLLYIFTTIPRGLNPEGIIGIGNAQGIEYAAMPLTRSFGFSVKASF